MDLGKNKKSRIAIFASGKGTNAEAIMAYFQQHRVVEVVVLLSNNPDAYALERAKKFNVPAKVFTKQQFMESGEVIQWLKESGVTHIVLAGFLWLIPTSVVQAFQGRIINIHPSLFPKFSGKGMYGMKVHKAVKLTGELQTGITIHVVNENYDDGEILFQERCPVLPSDTPEQIAQKVHELEYEHYPKVIEGWLGSVNKEKGN